MYRRTYEWDDKNQLIKSQDDNVTVCYTYGSDGQRASKYTENSETLYTNDFWVFHVSGSVRNGAGIINKNIYLGKMRVVTKVKEAFDAMEITERQCQYFYHSDHLGSAQLVTDNKGNEYQRIEYTPYGETWIDLKATQNDLVKLNYKFTAKELDEETGLYYYGARYLNPKYSMWISCDPAMNTGEYFPVAPTSEDARSHNQNLPGLGGVFNTVNLNLYHYAANNPIKYTDPDGRDVAYIATEWIAMFGADVRFGTIGSTWLSGKAFVTFTNTKTGESFTHTYDIRCYDSTGLNTYIGGSAGVTMYLKVFDDDNVSRDAVIDSYTGIFASISVPSSLNIVGSMFSSVYPNLSFYGVSISNTLVVGVDKDTGFFSQSEMPWVGINYSLSFNLVDLAFNFCHVQNPIPSWGIQYSVYKSSEEKWDFDKYNYIFNRASFYSCNNFPLPQITQKAIELLNAQ